MLTGAFGVSEDWGRDPFKLAEEGDFLIARGVADDEYMAAIFVDSLIRYRQENFTPTRSIRMALTCGEEGGDQVNDAKWLHQNRPDLMDVEFVINEGAVGALDENGNPVFLGIDVGQKNGQNFTLEVTDKGGHSSMPRAFNPIVTLGAGLDRLAAAPFPVQLNEVTKAYFAEQAPLHPGPVGDAMRAIVANPSDAAATATLAQNPLYNGMIRTTCVATTIEGGLSENALPQRVTANVNCRIMPESSPQETQDAIVKAVADPKISVTPATPFSTDLAQSPPLTPAVLNPIKQVAETIWPGTPVVPGMSAWATDAIYFGDTPVYGFTGAFKKPGESNPPWHQRTHPREISLRRPRLPLPSHQALRQRCITADQNRYCQ